MSLFKSSEVIMSGSHLRFIFIQLISFVFLGSISPAQNINIQLGSAEIALNQAFTITVTVQNQRLQSYDNFPDIPGFTRRGTSSSSSTNFINGQMTSSQSIIQSYEAQSQGTFSLKPFIMIINGERIRSTGKTIKVGPPIQRRARRVPFPDQFGDPFEDFFGRRNREPKVFMDLKDEAFLALTTDKKEVYVGEGFTTTLAFYIPQNNQAPMDFYDLGKQLTGILKNLKPANCWEENFNIENINRESVTINNRRYSKYKIYQATNYPLNLDSIHFPSVGLKMIKYKVAKNPSFFGRNRKQDYKTFYTRPRTVKVDALPPHPLKDQVAVGEYWLEEDISHNQLRTGESFNYNFTIKGEGNISAIEKPLIPEDDNFDFYSPNIKQNIKRGNNRVRGIKKFSYFGIPNEPGDFKLKDYVSWIYFNPYEEKYDTLKSSIAVSVTGESKRNEYILANDIGTFYDIIDLEDNLLVSQDRDGLIKLVANIFILLMLVLTAFFIFKK
ncbi:MAG: BatD family protein [Bacteroidetes bacterium]|nr:BatD family protein [Bacteroidota bacterium]